MKELSKEFFPIENSYQLSKEQKESCADPLTVDECLTALKAMKTGKSTGSDGFPSEFYKVFWADISTLLLKAIKCAYEKGLLSISQRSGILSLIPKENKLHCFIKNWRAITLLNTDYKIFAKAIANRIKKVLIYLINSNQTRFLKGRFIGKNIRTIEEIINFTEQENRPGLLLFIDFEKAFDNLEWHLIEKAQMHFNFGPSMIRWVKLFYSTIRRSVQNNGWVSQAFPLTRGVRQGCPLSPYLFILSAKILGNSIRKNKKINGIIIEYTEFKISQYADDTTIFLNGSRESFLPHWRSWKALVSCLV